jgi:LmbE family N-acetylglucosaminyl deacetylase
LPESRPRHHVAVSYTLVSFHAHPDDEALLTAGTLARACAEGHRVVLVVATAGEAGLTGGPVAGSGELGALRACELERSAAALGCKEVYVLGYEDSGMDGRLGRDGRAFARVDVDVAAKRLAAILDATAADALTVYDAAGGYGHPDHLQVHRVGVRAAEFARTPLVLEATVDRRALLRALRLLHGLRIAPADWDPSRFAGAYSSPELITHRVDVRRYTKQKRAAMAAHASQARADSGLRTMRIFLRLPGPLYRLVFGHEWFIERDRAPGAKPIDDIFAKLSEPASTDRQ